MTPEAPTDTCHTACALTRLLLDVHDSQLERARGLPRHEDVMRVFVLLADQLPSCRRSLDARPVHKKQAEAFDRALRCVTHLLHLLAETRGPQRAAVCARVRRLLAAGVRSANTGDTLLHLAVSRLNVLRSTYFTDETPVQVSAAPYALRPLRSLRSLRAFAPSRCSRRWRWCRCCWSAAPTPASATRRAPRRCTSPPYRTISPRR